MPVATVSAAGIIIAALIAGTASLIGAGLSAKQQDEARAEAKRLADIMRGDTLKARKEQLGLSRQQLRQSRQQFQAGMTFQKEEAQLGRAERAEERSYGRKRDVVNNALGLLDRDANLAQRVSARWGGR